MLYKPNYYLNIKFMIAKWLPEDYLKTIVLFEIPDGKSNFVPHGTGVLIQYKKVFFLATCKHVVCKPDGSFHKDLYATINKKDGTTSRKKIDDVHKQHGLSWYFHDDPKVDLALSAISVDLSLEDLKVISEEIFEDFSNIPLGDDIFFLGYPLGLGVQNVPKLSPLVRIGVIALKNSDKTFLLDANVYPGSSGSPVFYKPVLAQVKDGATNIGVTRPLKFLGLVNSNISSLEEAISKMTGRTRTIFEDNAGLGTVQSASLIIEILEKKEVQDVITKHAHK